MYNLKFINYNFLYDEVDLDFKNDFFDKGHLNEYGARKVSKHFSKYLIENNKERSDNLWLK